VSVTGLGGASAFDLNTIETLQVFGDDSNDDAVTITGTGGDDRFTVDPSATGGQVFLGGGSTEFVNPGIAGGSTGPDILINGVASTGGMAIDGASESDSDTLLYDGSPTITPSGPASGKLSDAGVVDVLYTDVEDVKASGTGSFELSANGDADDGTADTFDMTLNSSGELVVNVNGTTVLQQDVDNIDTLGINGSGDDDTLTVDFSNGDPVPSGGVNFVGGGEMEGDSLIVIGGGGNGVYSPSSTTNGDGTVSVDGSTITFTPHHVALQGLDRCRGGRLPTVGIAPVRTACARGDIGFLPPRPVRFPPGSPCRSRGFGGACGPATHRRRGEERGRRG